MPMLRIEQRLRHRKVRARFHLGMKARDFRVEIVGYDNIQFTKAPNVLRGMGLAYLAKNENAKKELAKKGMAVG